MKMTDIYGALSGPSPCWDLYTELPSQDPKKNILCSHFTDDEDGAGAKTEAGLPQAPG